MRALAADPPVIIMDEPFSALDPISREKLQDDLIDLQTQIKKTIVFVTHDIQEAMKLGDRICLLNEGHVEQIDTPEGFRTRPKSDFVKQFMGSHLDTTHNIVNQVKIKDLGINRPVDDNTNVIHYHEVDAELYLNNIYEDLSHYDAVVEYCSCSTNNSITGTTWFDDTNFRNWETSGNYRLSCICVTSYST